MLSLQSKLSTVDILSICDWLQRNNKLDLVGGMNQLLMLQSSIGSIANLESWCGILRDYAMLRETVSACSNALEMCKNSQQRHQNHARQY